MYEVHIKRPIIALALGFVAILSLMSSLIYFTSQQTRYAYQQVEEVIQNNNQKISLNYKMRLLGRERSIALQNLFLLDDPFDRDDAWMHYNKLASEFIGLRQQFLSLPLASWEKSLLADQDKLIRKTAAVQDEVGRLLLEEDLSEQALKVLMEQAIPSQDRVIAKGYHMIDLQEEGNASVIDNMQRAYQKELFILMIVGGIIFAISIAIAIYFVFSLGKLNKHLLNMIAERTHDLQQAKEQAEHATLSKSHYLAYVTHEIRNPLHGMLGLVEASQEDALPKRSAQYLETVQQSGEMLLLLLNDVLDLSKIEAGKLNLEYLDFHLETTIDSVIALLRGRMSQQQLSFQLDLDSNLPTYIYSEPTRLKQILINLLSNAIKFTAAGGHIRLRVYGKEDPFNKNKLQLFCRVKDTGQGISKDNMANLFKAYGQADETISRQFGGTGLGLLLSRQLVEMMKGKIWVESDLGQGSEFSFYIECQVAEKQFGATQENMIEDTPLKFKHALLVEDNSVNRQVAALTLKKFVTHLDISHNGQEAVDACTAKKYDIIFMDCYMPVLNGFDATEQIRQIAHCQHIPIIAMTGSAMSEERQRCFDVGMNDVLIKPYKRHELKQTLQKYHQPELMH